MKGQLIMKECLKEQIDDALEKVVTKLATKIPDALADNIQKYQESLNNEILKQYTVEMATLFTSIQFSKETLRNVLYELLCKD